MWEFVGWLVYGKAMCLGRSGLMMGGVLGRVLEVILCCTEWRIGVVNFVG